ncbi:TPA: glycosyltransferase, partial [Escherichia coli]|nr:glycosyltransferase [Escherichia coli]
MALLIISPSLINGGHEFQSIEFINELYKTRKSIFVSCANSFFYENINISEEDKEIFEYPQGGIIDLFCSFNRVKKHLKTHIHGVTDVLICGGTIEVIIFYSHIIKSIDKKIRVIGYVPMVVDKKILRPVLGTVQNYVLKILCGKVDEIITINKIQSYLFNVFYNKKTLVLPNKLKKISCVTSDYGFRLIYCGRLDNVQKNIIELIFMLDRINNPVKEFIIIGDGPEFQKILEISNKTRNIKVKIIGWASEEDINSILGINDILIMNSRWEGEPLVIREFIDRNLPVISRDIPGVRGVTLRKYRYNNENELEEILNNHVGRFEVKKQIKEANIMRMRSRVIAIITG